MNLQKQVWTILFFSLFSILPTFLFTQNNVQWAGAWQYGPADAVYADPSGDVVFLGAGGAVMVVDIVDPANPALLSDAIRTTGFVRDIWYQEDLLFLACGRGGLEIWDVSDLSSPLLTSRMDIFYGGVPAPVEEIELYNSIAVLMCDWGYVHTVDVSDPYSPQQLNFNGQMGNPAHHIYIDGDGTIHSTGAQYYLQLSIGQGGTLNSGGAKEFIYGAGNLYGRENEAFVYYNGYMYILDLTLPGFPAWSITEVTFSDIDVRDDIAYLVNNDGFEIWDVSDLQNPFGLSVIPFSYGNELFIQGDYAYVSADHEGLRIIDVSNPSDPQLMGQLTAYSWTPAVELSGTIAFVANGSGLYSVDLSNPIGPGPEMLGHIPTEGQLNDVACSGNLVFLADWTGGFRVVDATDPADMTELANVPVQAWKIAAFENTVYVAEANPNFPDTLKIFDVSNPGSPVMTASYTLLEDAQELTYSEEYLYVANFNSGLRIFDVDDPYDPVEVSFIDLPWVLDVAIEGGIAYVASADWEGGLVTVDISDPQDPSILQIYNPEGWFHPFHAGVDWPYAYASDIYGEMYVFDVTMPSDIQQIETITLPGDILNIDAMNGLVYVSDGQAGLQIFENTLITSVEEDKDPGLSRKDIHTYPNPAATSVHIDLNANSVGFTDLGIYDVMGKRIRTLYQGVLPEGSHHFRWNTQSPAGQPVPEGIYIIRLRQNGYTGTTKLVINR